MMLKNILPRVFRFKLDGKEIELEDPNVKVDAQGVMNFYANTYPILNNSKIDGPKIEDDKVVYDFTTTIGTKG